jgi:hypothetical protein
MLTRTALLAAAILAALCGWLQLARYSATPGEQSAAPAHLPAELTTASRLPVLLVFIHPQCSCTQATLQQLDQLLNRTTTPVELVLAVYSSAALRSHSPLPIATWLRHPYRRLQDNDGALARRFGAATSGEILLYSSVHQLLFQGGITPERARTGDNPGARALLAALDLGLPHANGPAPPASVFGCPIFHSGHAS